MSARETGGVERRFLHEIISTVASSLDLDEVLAGVVRLLSDASAVHACFVYLPDADGERLALRAASRPYSHLVDRIALDRGEGVAWWAFEHAEPVFIREGALVDPRMKYVPELEEERFQSLVCIPIVAKDGMSSIGVVSLHTEAPREFTDDDVSFLASAAALLGSAIENARHYQEARRRVAELELLTELGEAIARAETLDELLSEVTAKGRALLRAGSCHLYLLDPGGDELCLRASSPPDAGAPATLGLAELGPEVARRPSHVALPLVANAELLGLLTATGTRAADLARAVASQTAVALKKIDLIERLTEKNLIRDFFDQLAGGRAPGALEGRAERLGFDLDASYLVLAAQPADDELEKALAHPGTLVDRREDGLRALLRIPAGGEGALVERVRQLQRGLPRPVAFGLSNPCSGAASFVAGFEEARHALIGASVLEPSPCVKTYEQLGPYKYLLRLSLETGVRDSHRDAVARLAEYDRERSTQLLRTLEEFLGRRGSISATAEALYVHPNTLRQRLRRIAELTGIDLREDDWLLVEMAVKLVRLDIAGPRTV